MTVFAQHPPSLGALVKLCRYLSAQNLHTRMPCAVSQSPRLDLPYSSGRRQGAVLFIQHLS